MLFRPKSYLFKLATSLEEIINKCVIKKHNCIPNSYEHNPLCLHKIKIKVVNRFSFSRIYFLSLKMENIIGIEAKCLFFISIISQHAQFDNKSRCRISC